jgi:uncharacterized repeat protein (TIGR03803 family)
MLFALAVVVASLLAVPVAHAQTYTVLHNFTGGSDGGNPYAGLTLDAGGNLYGTTSGFATYCGSVFKLTRRSGSWTFSVPYSFQQYGSPCGPQSRVVFGPDGALYGNTAFGGPEGVGTVYKLQPPANFCPTISCEWTITVLYGFANVPDGAYPAGDVVFDSAGNLYGATSGGGNSGYTCADDSPCGTAFELTPSSEGWTESIIYNFEGGGDGAFPNGVIFDSSGHLDGTTSFRGGNLEGTVFSLAPNGQGQWKEKTYYSFSGEQDGGAPLAGVTLDGAGGFYGTTSYAGSGGGGTVWHLTPSDGNWLLNTLTSFSYSGKGYPPGSAGVLTMDAAGNLYGTTRLDGAYNEGSVFELTFSDGGWTLTTLYSFTGGSDGGQPYGQVVIDASGNMYGTASIGGSAGQCYQDLGMSEAYPASPSMASFDFGRT